MQITPATLAAIYYNFNTSYQAGYERPAPWYEKICTTVASAHKSERYAWMKLIPRLREWIGDRRYNNVVGREYEIINKDYEDSQVIDKNDILDDRIGVFSPMLGMMGEAARLWPDDVVFQLLQYGNTASVTAFDGQPYFNQSHPIDSDNTSIGTYSNYFPNTALNAANFNLVRSTMLGYKGEDNKPLKIRPTLLVCAPALEVTAKQLMQSTMIAPAGGFGINAAQAQDNVLKGMADILVIEEMAGTMDTTWLLLDISKPIKPFIWQLRQAPELVSLTDPSSENVFQRREYVYGTHARAGSGVTFPFLAAMAVG